MNTVNKEIAYIILDKNGKECIVEGRCPTEALGIFLKRGRFGLGAGWTLTRQPNGWIVASNRNDKTLQRTYHKLREVDYSRNVQYANA